VYQEGERVEGLIKKFLSVRFGFGSSSLAAGTGYGYGCGFDISPGSGSGLVNGSGSGSDNGSGSGFGSLSGFDNGSGYGFGYGSSFGSGSGSGSGYGYGDGDGSGIIEFEGQKVWYIDGIPSIIHKIRNNIAKGFILNRNLTLSPCYIAKVENCFAHAENIKEAVEQAAEKAFQSMPVEKRIEEFWKYHNQNTKYPARDLWVWHNKLTGSCEMGRNQFAAERGIDINNDSFTVEEFYRMCKTEYGGEIIAQMYELRR
jgi:hypothetical protein